MKKNKVVSIDKKVLPTEKTKNRIYKLYDKLEYLSDIIESIYNTNNAFSHKELKEKYHKDLIYLKHKSKKKIKKIKNKYWNYREKVDRLKYQLKMHCSRCGVNYVDFIGDDYELCKDCQTIELDFIDSSIENKENE